MKQMEVFLIAVFVLMRAIILIFSTMKREQEFISHTQEIQKSAVQGAVFASYQQLMLVKKSDPGLIEVTGAGSRDKFEREPRLSEEEMQRIMVHGDIENTDWQLINLSEKGYLERYRKGLWKEAVMIGLNQSKTSHSQGGL